MKVLGLVFIMFIYAPFWAWGEGRYLEEGKVVFERPLEQDVLKVNTAFGYCTVLEFPQKPIMVTVGDNSLIQVEIPKNSNNVVIKPLQASGETNLFVFTSDQRFNYAVTIGNAGQVDYVLDAQAALKDKNKPTAKLSVDDVLKIARGYDFYKRNRLINERKFKQKNLFKQCTFPKAEIALIEAFSNDDPHYLILHIVVRNITDYMTLELNEKLAKVQIDDKEFTPSYVLFDNNQLEPSEQTEGWLVLENSYVSLDNHFSISIGVEDEVYVCK